MNDPFAELETLLLDPEAEPLRPALDPAATLARRLAYNRHLALSHAKRPSKRAERMVDRALRNFHEWIRGLPCASWKRYLDQGQRPLLSYAERMGGPRARGEIEALLRLLLDEESDEEIQRRRMNLLYRLRDIEQAMPADELMPPF